MPVKVVNRNGHNQGGRSVYIGRSKLPNGKPSLFGNPFSHKPSKFDVIMVPTVVDAVNAYRDYAYKRLQEDPEFFNALSFLAQESASGKTIYLACFCKTKDNPDAPCHGDVLKDIIDFMSGSFHNESSYGYTEVENE